MFISESGWRLVVGSQRDRVWSNFNLYYGVPLCGAEHQAVYGFLAFALLKNPRPHALLCDSKQLTVLQQLTAGTAATTCRTDDSSVATLMR